MTITLLCCRCLKNFERSKILYEKNLRLGKRIFCSRSCVGKDQGGQTGKKNKRSVFNYYLERAKCRNGKEATITLTDLQKQWKKQRGICPYSKIALRHAKKQRKLKDERWWEVASLDKMDSKEPYIKENVEFVGLPINLAKNSNSKTATIELMDVIKERFELEKIEDYRFNSV